MISQTYSRVYIDSLISNYYNKTQVDALTGPQAYTYTTVLQFQDVSNLGINTLSIIGSTNINIKNNTNVSLMDFSEYIVEVHPPFKTYSTITSVGNATFPNIYTKTEVDTLLSNLSSNILATDSHVVRCAKIQFSDILNIGTTYLDIVGGSNITATYDDAAGTLTLAGSAAYSNADARQAISVTDNGGDGSLAYNNSTGVITYNGPSSSEVRAHLSAGTGITYSGGQISIGQAVATNSNVQFADLTLSGDLTVNGTTTTVSSTNSVIADALIELGNGTSGSPSNDAGFVIERGSSDNVFIGWDESADAVTFGTGSFTGASTGNLTITPSAVNTGALTITNATNSGGTARNVYQSTSAPTGSDGAVGDLWILYS